MMRPEVWSSSRITIIEVVDLPQPDSPTRPTLSPWPTEKLMPSTARNCSGSTGGLRENSFASVAVAPWRGYSLTSFSTRSSGFARLRASDPRERCGAGRMLAMRAVTGLRASFAASSSGSRSRKETPSRGVARISFLV